MVLYFSREINGPSQDENEQVHSYFRMYPKVASSWLKLSLGQDQALVRDHGRLTQLVSELPRPEQQYPTLSIFLGGKAKNTALQAIFPHNNIHRTRPRSGLGLRCESISVGTDEPILFADGPVDQINSGSPLEIMPGDRLIPCGSMKPTLQGLYSRLLFPFANLVCIFAADFPGLAPVARFLVDCAGDGSTSNSPRAVRPKIIVIMEAKNPEDPSATQKDIAQFYRILNESHTSRFCNSYSAVNVIHLDTKIPQPTRNHRLRAAIREQQDAMQAVRRAYQFCFNARHLEGLYNSALSSLSLEVETQFDFAKATREGHPVSHGLSEHLAHYLEAGVGGGCSIGSLTLTLASALLMDHYIPGMMSTYYCHCPNSQESAC